eukprot:24702-Pelagomonas_calceolata.AAC.2
MEDCPCLRAPVCLKLGVGGCAVAECNLEGAGVASELLDGIEPVLWCLELDAFGGKFDECLHKTWVVAQPTHVCVAAGASLVRQEYEGGNWLSGLNGRMHWRMAKGIVLGNSAQL